MFDIPDSNGEFSSKFDIRYAIGEVSLMFVIRDSNREVSSIFNIQTATDDNLIRVNNLLWHSESYQISSF